MQAQRQWPSVFSRSFTAPVDRHGTPRLRGLVWVRWACLSLVALLCIVAIEGHVYAIPNFYAPAGGSVFSIPTIVATALAFSAMLLQRPLGRPSRTETGLWALVIAVCLGARYAHGAGLSLGTGEMGVNTAVSFVLLALGHLSFGRLQTTSFALSLLALLPPFVALFGYLNWHAGFFGAMSLSTSVMLLALGTAGMARFARRPLMRALVSPSPVGRATRFMLLLWIGWLLGEALIMKLVPGSLRSVTLMALLMISAISCLGAILYLGMNAEVRRLHRRGDDRCLARAMRRDALTGLHTPEMAGLYMRGFGPKNAVGLIMLGLDHAEKLNDRHGAGTTDRILRVLSARVAAALGPDEVLVRWGEGALLALTNGLGQEALEARAEALRALGTGLTGEGAESLPAFTLSAGAVRARRGDVTLEPAAQRAEAALREAERAGCNRVVLTVAA
ncbi:diguanylate cyclase [Salipiger sp. P9]|uniref:GGDEF domain-containing protein n=1 Tax=Salipiger pentaromativorans TaxID=2943193 RepID=UPI00215889D9|nr:diguanylate cyclase [Salipiger pentaromativorans]MCR8547114.1 diguanylate cyclase [Salipiger pentaromativorans]